MFFIESERLRLIPLTHEQLQLIQADRQTMELSLGLNPSAMLIDPLYKHEIDDAMINFWLPKTLEHAEQYLWYTSWEIILKSTNTIIGGMGFGGEPNEKGEVETGYMIDGNHHNKGYATEALKSIIQWVFGHEKVQAITVRTYADNLPSRKMMDKCGFALVDDTDRLLTYRLKRPTS
ncbi:GNAT family N-acetyltransferase [Mucilaginibacter lappiensis]|uniref:RimJ/RimL family protein N-acetyltransferase n=1 Tax=Mucilaginibacter lappiensis TaxID=354630 RepID=A0A841JL68_9SPHI|nr:GNAT family N-acetyltransferase [Mucilaginibacter lappiensis]MBB6129115.1 RimJ/RimL family protein N-acetyltransferase [Mucilaginibacter lappiensis]